MQDAYVQVVIMLHAAFAGVFFFLNRQSPSAFARGFAWSWTIEALRATILFRMDGSKDWSDPWYCVSDVLGFLATWCLLGGCANLAEVKLPRWMAPLYFGLVLPFVVFCRFWMPSALLALAGMETRAAESTAHLIYYTAMFMPVGFARVAVVIWLYRVWKESRLPGALIASFFCVPFALVALGLPFQEYYAYSPDWLPLLWDMRVLGFSIGLVILMLNVQQAAVIRSESSLKAAQSLANIGSWERDLIGRKSSYSTEMYRLYGHDPAAGMLGHENFLAMIHPADRHAFQEIESQAVRERRACQHEFRIVRGDGSVRWIQGRNTPSFGSGGELVRMFGVEQDITERKHAESRMKLQHAVTRVLAEADLMEPTVKKILEIIASGLESQYVGFWIVDRSTRTLHCMQLWHVLEKNLTAFAALSRTELYPAGVGLPGRVLVEGQPIFIDDAEALGSENHARRDSAFRAGIKSGSAFPIILRGEIFGVIEILMTEARQPQLEVRTLFADLGTQLGQFIERQRLEDQYRQSQKMEAVGTLAGGIAHDFNNILTAINGYCELAQMEAEGNQAVLENLTAVQAGARRAVDLVRQIMAFSRQQGQSRTQIHVQPIVNEALKLLRATIPSTIEINTSMGAGIFAVLADATSIHQIIVNLGTNAWHSMRDSSGRMEVKLENVQVDAEFASRHPTLNPSAYVRLSISDTGHGMDQSTVSRIFEPFFTTKAPGEGTGLGLAVVHGIMKNHDGAILVHSRPGEGTRFDLYFPAYFGEDVPDIVPRSSAVPRGTGERILYLDDEKPLAQMGKKILEHLGYRVEIHSDALTALAAVRHQPNGYELVITDLTMPVMTGLELAQELLRLRPGLPIILTSGYTAALSLERLHAMGISEVLMKPHSFDSLATTVNQVFARERSNRQIRETRAPVPSRA